MSDDGPINRAPWIDEDVSRRAKKARFGEFE
jgi:hypothetical protein